MFSRMRQGEERALVLAVLRHVGDAGGDRVRRASATR